MAQRSKRRSSSTASPLRPSPATHATHARWIVPLVAALVVGGGIFYAMTSPKSEPKAQVASPPPPATAPTTRAFDDSAFAAYAGTHACRECHEPAYEAWKLSNHALAERDVLPNDPHVPMDDVQGKPLRVIGHSPLRQFLFPKGEDRIQAHQVAFDPHKKEWFDVFGNDAREPGDWGHWTGRGLNWNSMCAACHNTRLQKNYEPATDTYHTRMAEMSIGCESCHGPMKAHVDWQRDWYATTQKSPTTQPVRKPDDPTLKRVTRDQDFDTCGSCHARRGEITSDFVPGDSFHDHYRLAIVDESETYYPDGQVRDEDYEYTAFLGSRMHAAGVRCVDCHNAHTGKVIIDNDFLCMRCHNGSLETYKTAPIIKPAEHTFHKEGSSGARCVNCHMPQTTYMQRDPRHDHGFTVPDPLMTKQHGIPNACNRCHHEKDADWAIEWVDKWYGAKMQRHSRQRTQWIAAAKTGDESARQPLIELLANEKEFPYWKAAATGLLSRWIYDPATSAAVSAQLAHPDPLVRTEAARSIEPILQNRPDLASRLQSLLEDPVRSVRVSAAWSLRRQLNLDSLAGRDLQRMIEVNSDQPLGQLQAAHFASARNNPAQALKHMAKAVQWDPASAAMRQEYAVMLSGTGNHAAAVQQLEEACKLAPDNADYAYLLALAHNEGGDLARTINALNRAVTLDPRHARAWYNLGLALNATGKPREAITALQSAETAEPRDPRIPYARATILAQQGNRADALAAAQRALQIRPDYAAARELIAQLQR